MLVLFHSKTGHTLEAVNSMVEGIKSGGSEVEIVSAADFKAEMVSDCDAFIAASPCWAGMVGSTGAAKPLIKSIKSLPSDSLKGKRCGGIAVHAQTGGKTTVSHIGRLLTDKGCDNFKAGPVGKAGNLAGLGKGPALKPADEEKFNTYGVEFVK